MNRFCSIFSQLLQLFPQGELENTVQATGAERETKGFFCWAQFGSILFCQLGRAHYVYVGNNPIEKIDSSGLLLGFNAGEEYVES